MPRLPEELRYKPIDEIEIGGQSDPVTQTLISDAALAEEVIDADEQVKEDVTEPSRERWQPNPALVARLGLDDDPAVKFLRGEDGAAAQFTAGQVGTVEPPEDEAPFDAAEEDAKIEAELQLRLHEDQVVPLEEQKTESEEAMPAVPPSEPETVDERANLTAPAGITVGPISFGVAPSIIAEIDQSHPWASWPQPRFAQGDLHRFEVRAVGQGVFLYGDNHQLGIVSPTALEELGRRTTFPTEFVTKLPRELQAQVVNARIHASGNMEMTALFEGEHWTNILPAWRGIFSAREAAEAAYNVLQGYYPVIEIDHAEQRDGGAIIRLLTPVSYPVTPTVGDVLRMGIEVRHQYGGTLEVALSVKRLICLNGMTANQQAFSWRKRDECDAATQYLWLQQGILQAISRYTNLVERAQQMAATRFEGRPEDALRERATAMGYPARRLQALIDAFGAEPGDTEWNLVNAFSRVATHGGLDRGLARQIQMASGEWASNFEEVTARLPRPIAQRIGARIIPDESTTVTV